jgi:hypothetical protein
MRDKRKFSNAFQVSQGTSLFIFKNLKKLENNQLIGEWE